MDMNYELFKTNYVNKMNKLVFYCMAFASFYKTKETENSISILHTTFRYL